MMDLPVPNLPLLRKVLSHIDAHPDEWDQLYWGVRTDDSSCGTAFCVAGHALNMSPEYDCTFVMDPYDGEPRLLINGESASIVAAEYAQQELGLTRDEASMLFGHENLREDVQFIAEQIAERAGEIL